jgi:hypothetical protein
MRMMLSKDVIECEKALNIAPAGGGSRRLPGPGGARSIRIHQSDETASGKPEGRSGRDTGFVTVRISVDFRMVVPAATRNPDGDAGALPALLLS